MCNRHFTDEEIELLELIVRTVGQAHAASIACRHPSDSEHTEHDNQRNRQRDALEALCRSSGGRLTIQIGSGEFYRLFASAGDLEIVPMTRGGRYAGSGFQANVVGQFSFPFFGPRRRVGLQHDTESVLCHFVHAVELLDGDVEGERLATWVRDESAPVPVPWYIDADQALWLVGLGSVDAPPVERSNREAGTPSPRPQHQPGEGEDD